MASKRELVTDECISFIEAIAPGTPNGDIYREYLGRMTDADFEEWINRLDTGEEKLTIFVPINQAFKLTFKKLEALGKKIGHEFWHKLYITDPETGQVTLTETKHFVVDLILRRQVQMLWKKISVAENSNKVDVLTGQPTNESKGSSSSYPENMSLVARGMESTATEFIKMRGGDTDAYNVARRLIARDGEVSLKDIMYVPSRAKVVDTAAAYLKAMHFRHNL